MLARIQNDLFDLGADLCVPDTGKDLGYEPLRMTAHQTERLEAEIDDLNASLKPLRSFVLPGGHPAAAHSIFAAPCAGAPSGSSSNSPPIRKEDVSDGRPHFRQPAFRFLLRRQPLGQFARRWRCALGQGSQPLMFVPLHDNTPLQVIRFQYVTGALIIINVVVFLLTGAFDSEETLWAIATGYGIVPVELINVIDPGTAYNRSPSL